MSENGEKYGDIVSIILSERFCLDNNLKVGREYWKLRIETTNEEWKSLNIFRIFVEIKVWGLVKIFVSSNREIPFLPLGFAFFAGFFEILKKRK